MAKANQTQAVYDAMKKSIENGHYAPAQNLREADLSAEYDVSRNTIKKALLMLENDAYVIMEQNKGARVRSYSKKEVLDFLELREVLEGFVIHKAVPFFTPEALGELRDIIELMRQRREAQDLLGYSAMNRQFHQVIYSVCPNLTANDVLQKLKNQMKKYNSKSILIPGRCDISFAEHQAIYQAIAQGDADLAKTLMEKHISSVRSTYDTYYSILF